MHKVSRFCFRSGFIAPAPYVTLIYVEIASYNQLALMFTLVTIGSITGPLLMGNRLVTCNALEILRVSVWGYRG